MQAKAVSYIPRPAIDAAISRCLSRGAGVFAIEGPGGAGKSAALLHGLYMERERRGKSGRGHVRILQLWGDEPPSLFAQRLVREVGLLNLVAYPQPDDLAKLAAEMAQAIPGLSTAGKILGSLLPDDMRPLPLVAAQALAEAGRRAIEAGDVGGPLCIGIDLLGGDVSAPVRDFFSRLAELLPETVVLLFAQPGGQHCLLAVPPGQRIAVGAFSPEEARQFLEERLGALDEDSLGLLASRRLSLLPGDLSQIVNLYAYLGAAADRQPGHGEAGQGRLREVLPYLERDIAARYDKLFESQLLEPRADARAIELCALCAVTARPQHPLTLELALTRMGQATPLRPSELSQLRQSPLVRTLCAGLHAVEQPTPGGAAVWPIEPASAQVRDGVRQALRRHGLLDIYEKRWLHELISTLRRGEKAGDAAPGEDLALLSGPSGLYAGVQALSLLIERASRDALALGQAVSLLGEMETLLWRAGWHRTFAELYDALLPHLRGAGVSPRQVAPRLWFRRARTRIQNVDWSEPRLVAPAGSPQTPVDDDAIALADEEIQLAQHELSELTEISESDIVLARMAIGLPSDGAEVGSWSRHLPYKASQARGYASVLRLLLRPTAEEGQAAPLEYYEDSQTLVATALDDILAALSHFTAEAQSEDVAQTLTILGDFYSARARLLGDAASDRLAQKTYAQAVAVAERMTPPPLFALGIIHRSIANHHRRSGRGEQAALAYAAARTSLLRSPDARMGTLLAGLLPG